MLIMGIFLQAPRGRQDRILGRTGPGGAGHRNVPTPDLTADSDVRSGGAWERENLAKKTTDLSKFSLFIKKWFIEKKKRRKFT